MPKGVASWHERLYDRFVGSLSGSLSSMRVNIGLQSPEDKELSSDAWGRAKAIYDKSIIHGMFTHLVPVSMWYESLNGVELTSFVNATSVNGELNLTSNGVLDDSVYLRTFRNPRYQPNRGLLYSPSIFLPNPTAAAIRRFGCFTPESGFFFELDAGVLKFVIRTTYNSVTSDDPYIIDTTQFGADFDLECGNIYDAQAQWRGVGNYYAFVNTFTAKYVDYLGKLTKLSMFNPANPIAFECINKGDDAVIKCGCVDVTSEGGDDNGKTYGSIVAKGVSYSGTSKPILIVRNKKLMASGLINTRDIQALTAIFSADARCDAEVWVTRDASAITLNSDTWTDYGDGALEFIKPSTATFDTAKAINTFSSKIPANQTFETSALYEGVTDIFQTPGDIFIFAMTRGGTTVGDVTYELGEEI